MMEDVQEVYKPTKKKVLQREYVEILEET